MICARGTALAEACAALVRFELVVSRVPVMELAFQGAAFAGGGADVLLVVWRRLRS